MKFVFNSFIDLILLWFVDVPFHAKNQNRYLSEVCKGGTGSSKDCCSPHSVITDSTATKQFSNIKELPMYLILFFNMNLIHV
jgi:hypothetical protein